MSENSIESELPEEVIKAATKADAKERSLRTLKQSLLVTLGITVATAIIQGVSVWTVDDFMSSASWGVLGVSVIHSVATAILSFIHRYTKSPKNSSVG